LFETPTVVLLVMVFAVGALAGEELDRLEQTVPVTVCGAPNARLPRLMARVGRTRSRRHDESARVDEVRRDQGMRCAERFLEGCSILVDGRPRGRHLLLRANPPNPPDAVLCG
jgi:hypothetical protein